MTAIAGLIDLPIIQALAWALVHFVWQGALVGLLAVAALHLFRLAPPARYALGVMALAVMLAAPVVTLAVIVRQSPAVVSTALSAERLDAVVPAGPAQLVELPAAHLSAAAVAGSRRSILEPLVLGLWLLGVAVLSVRLFGGWMVARRLARRAVRPASPELQSLAQRIAGRLALERVVRVVESSAVAVPMLVGWLKPVVLLPASALSGLTPTQVEALLAHELAHVRRHDYLVNLLQSAVETLLFYHPAVWWVSRQVRREREHCCDDLAVGVCDRLEYVTALASLAAMTTAPRPALAATDGSLVGRIRRLLSPSGDDEVSRSSGWIAVSVIVLAVLVAGASVPAALGSTEPGGQTPVVTPVALPAIAPSTTAAPAPGQLPVAGAPVAGVPGGVREGVPGGVPAGVPGGIPSGVPGGVSGGVPGAFVAAPVASPGQNPPPPPPPPARVMPPVPPPPPSPRDLPPVPPPAPPAPREVPPVPPAPPVPDQDPERVRAIREVERAMRDAQIEFEMKRLELEMQRAQVEAQAQLEAAAMQMELLKRQIERTKQLVDKGLASPEAQAALEAQLAAAAQQVRTAEADLDLRQSDIALRRQEAEVRATYERRLAELGMARVAEEVAAAARSVGQAMARDRARDVEQGVAAAARAERESDIRRAVAETVTVARDEPARTGDVLALAIAGEPDLPERYTVRPDGTIRIPFVGSVRVQGMTADQIREAVARQLSERNLKANPSVTVTIRRPVR
jgi:beta-lactamase regulating signal transducer with metallopeptidase domain